MAPTIASPAVARPKKPIAQRPQVIIQVGPRGDATPLAIIHVRGAIDLLVEEEGVTAQQERPVTAAIAWNKAEVVRILAQVARVIRKIEHRNPLHPERRVVRSEEHTSELQSLRHLVCRLLLENKN